MQLFTKSKTLIGTIPQEVKHFIVRAIIIFIVWKLLYHLVLFPTRFPDRQLTLATAASTTILYSSLTSNTVAVYREVKKPGQKDSLISAAEIYINNKKGIGIADACNGLELHVLYVGFLFCFPFSIQRKLIFALLGIIGIFLLNTLRCYGLTYLFLHDFAIAEFAHHYLFKIILYAAIFFTWTRYAKNYFEKIH